MKRSERFFQIPRLIWSFPIFVYQVLLSPVMGNQCIYRPTCSRYSMLAILRHGIFRGTSLGFWRILRCNPFNNGGDDPVPK